jgi:hypothetical protein
MCCLVTSLFFLGPRAAIVVWWLLQPVRWSTSFSTWVWPVLGFLFLPWTTLAFVVVAPSGVHGAEWLVILLGFLLDVASYTGGYGNRGRVANYAQ